MALNRVSSLEILLVVDNEDMAQLLSEVLRRAGHCVTIAMTIAGCIETLMRRGPHIDVIITSTRFDSSLGDDIVPYGRKLAPNARFIALGEAANRVEQIDLAVCPSAPDHPQPMVDLD